MNENGWGPGGHCSRLATDELALFILKGLLLFYAVAVLALRFTR